MGTGGKLRRGRGAYPSTPSSAVFKNRVDLYLYLPLRAFVAYEKRETYPIDGVRVRAALDWDRIRPANWLFSK
jgi:hypothetical protein